jgi:aminoglycoside phosphotransferase (APT) family kinase protein
MDSRAIGDDTINVRPDERFDEKRLAAYLNGRLPGADRLLRVRQFGGGAANLTYLLDYGVHEYVLRRPPLGPVARSAHDMGREYRVLSVLHQVYPYAPRAFLYCDDETIIGAPFFVMERKHGVVVRRLLPDIFASIPDAPRRVSEALVDALVEFHAVNYEAVGLAELGRPAGFVQRQIEGWYRRWQAATAGTTMAGLAEMERVYQWLCDRRPLTAGHSLVHNDYKLDNVMLAADDPGRVVAVFDWDMCTLGDPLSDLGALLAYWSEPSDPPHFQPISMMPAGALGFLTRAELVVRYAAKSGRPIDDIHFYHTLGLFRLAVILAQIYVRYARGQTQDGRFAAFGELIPLTVRAAREVSSRQ